MSATLELIIALVGQIVTVVLPALGSDKTAQTVTNIIAILEKVLPDIISAGEELTTTTQNIIAALKNTDGVTPEQWVALDGFETKIDNEFEQSAADEGFAAPQQP